MAVVLVRRLERWGSPLLLMALIYFLSAQPELSSGLGLIDLIGRKILHAASYGLLCFLWWRALVSAAAPRLALALALCVAIAYAISDEYHQTFVAGRSGAASDVAIDAVGAVAAAVAVRRRTTGEGRDAFARG